MADLSREIREIQGLANRQILMPIACNLGEGAQSRIPSTGVKDVMIAGTRSVVVTTQFAVLAPFASPRSGNETRELPEFLMNVFSMWKAGSVYRRRSARTSHLTRGRRCRASEVGGQRPRREWLAGV